MVKQNVIDAKGFVRTVNRLAHEIIERNKGAETLGIVGIRTRGDFLAQRIAQKIFQMENVQIPIGSLDITLYRDDLRGRSTSHC
jgi:pyrimidine operon attenuation protein/uracil phosphoribosyltransferase